MPWRFFAATAVRSLDQTRRLPPRKYFLVFGGDHRVPAPPPWTPPCPMAFFFFPSAMTRGPSGFEHGPSIRPTSSVFFRPLPAPAARKNAPFQRVAGEGGGGDGTNRERVHNIGGEIHGIGR